MSGVQAMTVAAEEAELRLDRWFKRHFPGLGHGRLEKLLRTGQVRIDGKRARAGDRLVEGQIVRVPPLGAEATAPPRAPTQPQPRQSDLDAVLGSVLYRDEDVIALDKPAGLAVQGGTSTERHLDMMLDALRFRAKERPRLVHRLDKDTSGVLLLARSAASAAKLTAAFREKATKKIYWAVTVGVPTPRQGRIDLALGKVAGRFGERVAADPEEGKRARTLYRVVDSAGDKAAFVALAPVTGRTHQLRVHMASVGAPILGDGKYGGAAAHLAGVPGGRLLHLHARALAIPHPKGFVLTVTAPLPLPMRRTFEFFGFEEEKGDPFGWVEDS
jgi:23S rRNA pseudouridine955/2504/2580 synthase